MARANVTASGHWRAISAGSIDCLSYAGRYVTGAQLARAVYCGLVQRESYPHRVNQYGLPA